MARINRGFNPDSPLSLLDPISITCEEAHQPTYQEIKQSRSSTDWEKAQKFKPTALRALEPTNQKKIKMCRGPNTRDTNASSKLLPPLALTHFTITSTTHSSPDDQRASPIRSHNADG